MNKRIVLYTMIVLLIIFFPLTIYSYTLKNKNINNEEENIKHFPYFKGYLWFYNEDALLINKYKCENERCTYTYPIINQKYVFITDGNLIKLYDIINNQIYNTYNEVKKEDNVYLVSKDNLWGVYEINEEIKEIEKIVNESITILNHKLIIKKDNKWTLKDQNKTILSNLEHEIVAFNNNYVISKGTNEFMIYDLNGNLLMNDYYISNYSISDNYLALVINNTLYIYKDLNNNYLQSYYLNNIQNISIEEGDNNLLIKQDNILLDTLAIS